MIICNNVVYFRIYWQWRPYPSSKVWGRICWHDGFVAGLLGAVVASCQVLGDIVAHAFFLVVKAGCWASRTCVLNWNVKMARVTIIVVVERFWGLGGCKLWGACPVTLLGTGTSGGNVVGRPSGRVGIIVGSGIVVPFCYMGMGKGIGCCMCMG